MMCMVYYIALALDSPSYIYKTLNLMHNTLNEVLLIGSYNVWHPVMLIPSYIAL